MDVLIKDKPLLSMRSSNGLSLLNTHKADYSSIDAYKNFKDDSKNCRVCVFSSKGDLFAYCNNFHVKVLKTSNLEEIAKIEKPRTSHICFSPNGNFFILWEPFLIKNNEPTASANLCIYSIKSLELVSSFEHKKQLENFIQWSSDESFFALIINGEIRFYETVNPSFYVKNVSIENLSSFKMNPVSKCIAVHVAGKKSTPSSLILYQYPNISQPIALKSFFNADNVEVKWNKMGQHALLLCSTETSANSYYGDTTLNYINNKGDSININLSKKGPIYNSEWNPVKDEFIIVYGSMPAKATLYNSKCEAIFDFGTGARNDCFFNTSGNLKLVCLCGFGNIRGRIEVWNVSATIKVPQQVCSITADDTTYFEWCPDGEHMLTATTAPRLRVSNGFKIWNYLGEKKYSYDMPSNSELWQMQWQPGSFEILKQLVLKKNPAVVEPEKKAYVPPHLRGKNQISSIVAKLHEDEEKPDTCLKIKEGRELDPTLELEKKIKAVKKKLQQIDELKEKQNSGVKLEANQLQKLKNEDSLLEELKKLTLTKK